MPGGMQACLCKVTDLLESCSKRRPGEVASF